MSVSFSGTVYHQLDDKGRIRIPSKFTKLFIKKEGEIAHLKMMVGTQGCISVYLPEQHEERMERMRAIPDDNLQVVQAKRKIMSSIEDVETDKQYRIVLPPALRAYARINGDVVTVGNDDHFEIWAKEVYDPIDNAMSFQTATELVGYF